MPVLGLRYPKAFTQGEWRETLGLGTRGAFNGTQTFGAPATFYVGGESGEIWLAPSRYSEVRKVVFWAVIRQESASPPLAGQPGYNVRTRIAPRSTSAVVRNIETALLTAGSTLFTTGGGSTWSNDAITSENILYNNASVEQELFRIFNSVDDEGSQILYVEFERFGPTSEDFFADWDQVAVLGNDDSYMAFRTIIERTDGVDWNFGGTGNANNAPIILTTGCTVVQAPATQNNTCTLIQGSLGLRQVGALVATFGPPGVVHPFHYLDADWDNIESIHAITRLDDAGAAGNGNADVRVAHAPFETGYPYAPVQRHVEAIGGGAGRNFVHRSADIKDLIQDDDFLFLSWRRTDGSHDLPRGWFEIIQKDCSRTICAHNFADGHPFLPPTPLAGGDDYNYNCAIFDPTWYQAFPDSLILGERLVGSMGHRVGPPGGNDGQITPVIDATEFRGGFPSAFTEEMQPEVTTTPAANLGFKSRDGAITLNNLRLKLGIWKIGVRWGGASWNTGAEDRVGGIAAYYALAVPNSEFLELGPIFDVGAFNADGCAATAAGLGQPATLVITNGATIPKKFVATAAGTTGEIEDAGIPTPYEGEYPSTADGTITVTNHGNASPCDGLEDGTYTYRYTFRNCCTDRESDPNPDDIVVVVSGGAPRAQVNFSFAGIRIPADAQICEICLYRTISGGDFPVMFKVGCFDPDVTTTFVDTLADGEICREGLDSLSILNAPNPCAPIIVEFRNRLFMMGDIPDLTPEGTVSVENGSDIVIGDDSVDWDRCLEGKKIKIEGDCRAYEILRVLPPEVGTSPPIARLRLVDVYEGTDGTGLDYTICGHPNRLWVSEPLEPEYWPAANFIEVEPGDGDRIMGAVSNFDRLVICKRRKTYVLTFRENPVLEVVVPTRISSDIGCVGPRTFAQIESGSAWLAERGIALYDGRTARHVQESEMMNDLFVDPDNPNYVRRDRNGRVIDAVAVFYPKREQYLLLLPTIQTERGCNLMVVWDVHLQNVTLLKFCQEFQSMVVAKDDEGNERVYLGDTNGFVWILDVGDTDGAGFPNATGTVRGTITASGIDTNTGASFLEDSSASFIVGGLPGVAGLSGIAGLTPSFDGDDMGLAGVCVYIRAADADQDDPWDVRTIYASTSTRLYVTPNWAGDIPPVGYEYMIGAIEFNCVFKPQNYGTDDITKRDWRQVVIHEVENVASDLRVELLPDFQNTDPEELTIVNAAGETGDGRHFFMDYQYGRQVLPVGRNVHSFMAVRMSNFAPEEPIRIINHLLMVTPRTSK